MYLTQFVELYPPFRLAMPVDALSASPSLAPLALPQRLRPQQSSVATSTTSLPSIVALQPAVASPLSQTAVQTDALPRPALVSASSPHVNPSTTANTATKVASGPAGHDSLSSASAAGSTSVFLPHEQWQQLQQFQQYQSMMYQQQLQQQWFLQHAAQQQHSQHPQQLPLMLPFPFPAVNPWMGPFAPVGPIPPLPNASPLNSLRGNQNTSSAYVSSADSSSANSPTLEQSRSEARQPSAIANASQPVERAHELLPAAVSTLSSEPASIASDAAVEIAPISSAVSLAIDPSSATDEALSIPMLTPSDACAAPLPLPASSSVTPSTVCLSSSTRAEDVLPSSAEARPFAVPVAAASSSHASLTAPEPVPSPIPEPMTNQRADSTIVAQGVVRYQDTGLSTAAASHNSPADGPSLSFTVRDGLSLHLPRLPTSIEFQPVHHEHHPSAIAGATTTSLPGPSSTLTAVASDVETPAPVPSSVSALPSNPVASATSAASLASLAAASTDPYIARLLARMPDLVHDPQWPQFVRQLREVRGGGSA